MPAERDAVTVAIGGREHRDWTSYEIESDLLTPADAWRVSLGIPAGAVPPTVAPWAPVLVAVGGVTVLSGRIDGVQQEIARGRHTLSLSGRDGAAVLVDCSAPVFASRQVDLDEVVASIVRPLGIGRIDVRPGDRRGKVAVEPGMTAWDALQQAAEANGMWPWFRPDGTLVVGGPDYTTPPVADLVLRMGEDSRANNVLSLSVARSVQGRFSMVTVLGQNHGNEDGEGENALSAVAKDSGVAWHRPKISVESQCDSTAMAMRRARKLLADGKLSGLEVRATVRGHHALDASGLGPLWEPGQRVRVQSEPHGLDATLYLMSRTFLGGRDRGAVTDLVLKADGVWLPDVGKRRRKRRKGDDMEDIDLD